MYVIVKVGAIHKIKYEVKPKALLSIKAVHRVFYFTALTVLWPVQGGPLNTYIPKNKTNEPHTLQNNTH